jgi:hypothetical protein
VLSTYLYKLTNKLGTPSYHLMAAVAVCIVAMTIPLVLIQRHLLQNARRYATIKGKAGRMRELPLGRWKWLAVALVGAWLLVAVVVPLTGIALRAFVTNWGFGVRLADAFTLDNFRSVFEEPTHVRAIWNTILLGTVGGAIAVACYTAIGFATHRRNDGWSRVVDVRLLEMLPHLVAIGGREQRADREQVTLDRHEHLVDARHLLHGADEAECGVQFVDVAVRFDTRVVLENSPAAKEARITGVAGLGVDLHGGTNVRRGGPKRDRFDVLLCLQACL